MVLILDCAQELGEFLDVVTKESFPICDIDAFLSITVDAVFNKGEEIGDLINSLINQDRLFSEIRLTDEEKERIRYAVTNFTSSLEKKIIDLKITFSREVRFDYKGRRVDGYVWLKKSYTP